MAFSILPDERTDHSGMHTDMDEYANKKPCSAYDVYRHPQFTSELSGDSRQQFRRDRDRTDQHHYSKNRKNNVDSKGRLAFRSGFISSDGSDHRIFNQLLSVVIRLALHDGAASHLYDPAGSFLASQPRNMPPPNSENMIKKISAKTMNMNEGISIRVYFFPK